MLFTSMRPTTIERLGIWLLVFQSYVELSEQQLGAYNARWEAETALSVEIEKHNQRSKQAM